MSFRLTFALEADYASRDHVARLQGILDRLSEHMRDRKYGNDVLNVGVKIRCLKARSGFEKFYQLNKPKFIKEYSYQKIGVGTVVVENTFNYEYMVSDAAYKSLKCENIGSLTQAIGQEVLSSLGNLDKLPKKKRFDRVKFEKDMSSYFKACKES